LEASARIAAFTSSGVTVMLLARPISPSMSQGDAAVSDRPVFRAELLVGLGFIPFIHRAVGPAGLDIPPDLLKFLINEYLRRRERGLFCRTSSRSRFRRMRVSSPSRRWRIDSSVCRRFSAS